MSDAHEALDAQKAQKAQVKYNVWSELQDKPIEVLKSIQKCFTRDSQYGICMFNIHHSGNIGMTVRTACIMGFDKFIICGRHHYDKRFTVGAHNYIDIVHWTSPIKVDISILSNKTHTHTNNPTTTSNPNHQQYKETINYFPEEFIAHCKMSQYTPVFVEQGGVDIRTRARTWKHIEKPLLVFGNESLGIPKSFMITVCTAIPDACIVSIPQWSIMRSLNISNAASIAMWELRRCNEVLFTA